MLENLHCKCHICKVERHLFKSLAEPPANVRFSTLALSAPALARFSNLSELLSDLHSRRNGDSGASLAGELVPVLISAGAGVSDIELIQAVLPKSGVNFVIFVQICPKIDICSQNLCSSRSNFTKVPLAFQRFQPVNSTQYLLGLLRNEGRVD